MMSKKKKRGGVVGKDGRTDALAETVLASSHDVEVVALTEVLIPGLVDKCVGGKEGVTVIESLTDVAAVVAWADATRPDFVIVGPEEPLAAGVVDALAERGIPCFGPTQSLARVESSKIWARELVAEFGIAGNPRYEVLRTREEVARYMGSVPDFVVKADGLRGGKGVRLYPEHFTSIDEAIDYGAACIEDDGAVLVEERLVGEEFSLQTITDGTTSVHCPLVQDHKRAFEGDVGPNTGGMGSYSCPDLSLPFLTPSDVAFARGINEQVIEAMYRRTGQRYKGVLYGGYMITADGVRLIEFNCRFGDPEALNVLPLLQTDFLDVVDAVLDGQLHKLDIRFSPKATVCKYIVPEGYPDGKGLGDPISVPEDLKSDPAVRLYWAATMHTDDGPRLTSSRALAVVGIGDTLAAAEAAAETAAGRIDGEVRFRHDIGTAALVAKRVEHMAQLRDGAGMSESVGARS